MTMTTGRVLTLVAALLIAAPGLVAQEEPETERPHREHRGMMQGMQEMHGMQRMHGQRMHGMHQRGMRGGGMMPMPAGAPGPMLLLRAREALDLTDQQVERIESLHADLREAHGAHMEQARAAQARAREALRGDTPDLDAAEAALEEAAAHRIQAHMTMARGHLRARDVLTEEQRTRLSQALEMMRSLRPERPAGPRAPHGPMPMGPRSGERPPAPPPPPSG